MRLNKEKCRDILNSHKRGKVISMANQQRVDWEFKDRDFTIRLSSSLYSEFCEIYCIWNILNGDHFKFNSEEQLQYFLENGVKG